MSTQFVLNPLTGRWITVGGATHRKLLNAPHPPSPHLFHPPFQPRGSRTRGWKEDAPRKGVERHELLEKCGKSCFLMPEQEKFPICRKCVAGQCACQVDCRGLTAAKIRAHQYKYQNLYPVIDQLEDQYCRQKKRKN